LAGQNPMGDLLGYAQQNNQAAYQTAVSNANAKANNKGGIFGGLLSAGGAIGSAALMPAGVTNIFGSGK